MLFSVNALAISNCLEEAKYHQAHTPSIETLIIDYLKIDTESYNSTQEYYELEGMKDESIPIIETNCIHPSPDFFPIKNGVYNGQYFILFKGRSDSDGADTHLIEMILFDTKSFRRHIIGLESISFGEGIYGEYNSSLKFDELTFYSHTFMGIYSEAEFSDDSELFPNKVKSSDYIALKNGLEKRCISLGPAKEDDAYLTYMKNEVIYNCQERFQYTASLSEMLLSNQDYSFNSFDGPAQSHDEVFDPFNRKSYIFKDINSYMNTDKKYEVLSNFEYYNNGSPFFYEGSVEQIFEHYSDPYALIELEDWFVRLQNQPSNMLDASRQVELQVSITKDHVSIQTSHPNNSENVKCDDNYKAYFKHDLLVLEYQGMIEECLSGDNRFIMIKRLQQNWKDFVIRGNILNKTGWIDLYVVD
ncbi:hypothetical protein [Thorsellia anophelis]|nr:hypothetical protein [Thorsellia anophelis]